MEFGSIYLFICYKFVFSLPFLVMEHSSLSMLELDNLINSSYYGFGYFYWLILWTYIASPLFVILLYGSSFFKKELSNMFVDLGGC